MLDLGLQSTIEWTTVFPDDSNPNHYWFLPNHVRLDVDSADPNKRPVFRLIQYTSGDGTEAQGAFLNMQVLLTLPKPVEDKIRARIPVVFAEHWKDKAIGKIELFVAPWDSGTVECVAFDSRRLRVPPDASGAPPDTSHAVVEFVHSIAGAATPSLDATNRAIFSIHLSKEGAQLVAAALKAHEADPAKQLPLGIIYSLQYTGLSPSFRARITAKMQNVYEHFSAKLQGQKALFRAGITAGLEDLKAKNDVTIEIVGNDKKLEKFVMKFFEEKIINEFMKPVLTPGELKGMVSDPESLDDVIGRAADGGKADGGKDPGKADDEPDAPPDDAPDDGGKPDDVKADDDKKTDDKKDDGKKDDGKKDDGKKDDGKGGKDTEKLIVDQVIAASGKGAISFQMKYLNQRELREYTFDLSKRQPVQRTFAPQQFLQAFMRDDMGQPPYVTSVVLDSLFFETFPITVYPPARLLYEHYGLSAATVTLAYQGSSGSDVKKTFNFALKDLPAEGEPLPQQWKPHLSSTSYKYAVEYSFLDKTKENWLGLTKLNHQGSTEARALNLAPSEQLQFLEIEIVPAFDEDDLEFVKVAIKCGSEKAAYSVDRTEKKQSQFLRLRMLQPRPGERPLPVLYQLTWKYKNRNEVIGGWKEMEQGASELRVGGWSRARVTFELSSLDPDAVKSVNLSVKQGALEEKLLLTAKKFEALLDDSNGEATLALPIINDEKKAYKWQTEVKWKDSTRATYLESKEDDRAYATVTVPG